MSVASDKAHFRFPNANTESIQMSIMMMEAKSVVRRKAAVKNGKMGAGQKNDSRS